MRTLHTIIIEAIRQALIETGGRKRETARMLGISQRNLYSKICDNAELAEFRGKRQSRIWSSVYDRDAIAQTRYSAGSAE
jgi:hypothetical protein